MPENPSPENANSPESNPKKKDSQDLDTVTIRAGQKPAQSKRSRQPWSLRVKIIVAAIVVVLVGGVTAGTVSVFAFANQNQNASAAPETLRLGYFGNVTHALPLVGVQNGTYQRALGDIELQTQIFSAGPTAIEALNAGAIDAAYLGPNPAINAYVKSEGAALRIVAGAASAGAQFVVREGINNAEDLRGKTLSTPQLGGTQDVALRTWLGKEGLETGTDGQGDVTINPTDNAQTLSLFQKGEIDGAWLPEPWASRLVIEAGAKVLVDEKDLWENGEFPTTILVVRKDVLDKWPETIRTLISAQLETLDEFESNPGTIAESINAGLIETVGADLPPEVLDRSLSNLTFTADPNAGTYSKLVQDGVDAGVVKAEEDGGTIDIGNIFDLSILNEQLRQRGQEPVSAAGLGRE